jgi:non-canonical purine NTP pyrophosphatase (RdgB/HAM1 family)
MKDVVFITGNQRKADYLAQCLGYPIEHVKVDLEEIQSLDFKEVIRHKVREAYAAVGRPVLVEDTGLSFAALGRLPGPLIRWFIEELSLEGICRLLDGRDRAATARSVFGYYDGSNEAYFEGSMDGTISEKPRGEGGFGFDSIFIPEGYEVTRAQMNEEDDRATYLKIKPFEQVRTFLIGRR